MEGCRFKPENYHDISRVLGNGYAPDLNRVTTKHRADAASAYLRRLRRDVERSQGGYYSQLQALPLQIKRLPVRKEDPCSFKSVLIPKLKLSPLPAMDGSTPSPRTVKESPSPKMESPAGGGEVPTHVVLKGSSYVPHKYLSPHSHTHIHVLFKQIPGQTSHQKSGASSIVSSEISGSGGGGGSSSSSGIFTDNSSKAAFRFMQHSLKNNSKLPSPREAPGSSPAQEYGEETVGDSGAAWPAAGDRPLAYRLPKFHANLSLSPPTSRSEWRLLPPRPLGRTRLLPELRQREGTAAHDSSGRSVFKSPRGGVAEHQPGGQAWKSGDSSPVNPLASGKDVARAVPPEAALPPNVAAALAAGSSLSALYKLDMPHLAAAYHTNLPTTTTALMEARPKAASMGMMGGGGGGGTASKGSPRLPLPSIPANAVNVENEMLAITSVQRSNAVHLAAV